MSQDVKRKFFDLRRLIGYLLTFYGIVIGGYGLIKDPKAQSAPFNLDLWWGLLILVIGIVFLLLSLRQSNEEEGGKE